jgi:hypothetical protein
MTNRTSCVLAAITPAVVLGAALGPCASAAADPPPRVSLTWTAPAGCPASGRVVKEVDRLLGATAPRRAPLVVVARVTAKPDGGLRVRIEAAGSDGARVRELEAASCDALADATATILALMIDPTSVVAPPDVAAADAGATAVAPPLNARSVDAGPPDASAPDGRLPSAPLPWAFRFGLDAWLAGDVGSAPGAGAGAAGALVFSLGPLRVDLGLLALPARTATVPAHPTLGGDVSLITGAVSACYDVVPRSASHAFELSPCLGYEVGRLHASGFGVTNPGEGDMLWSAIRPGLLFAWAPLARLAIFTRVDAAVPFVRQTFVLENVGDVYRPGIAAGRLGLGLEVRP